MLKEFNNQSLSQELYALCQQAFEHGSPWNEQQFSSQLERSQTLYEEYRIENRLIGFILYDVAFETADLLLLVVNPLFQRQGIAHQLISRSVNTLKNQSVSTILLEVRQSNQTAIKLYQKECFKEISIRKKYYQSPVEDALILQRQI